MFADFPMNVLCILALVHDNRVCVHVSEACHVEILVGAVYPFDSPFLSLSCQPCECSVYLSSSAWQLCLCVCLPYLNSVVYVVLPSPESVAC